MTVGNNPDTSRPTRQEIEEGHVFLPKFDAAGLIPAVVLDAEDRQPLVVAYMNRDAIDHTIETGKVTFWSRSRSKLWTKGETSGHFLKLAELWVDCDQDALVVLAHPVGPTCHTGRRSCFYRRLEDNSLVKVNT